MGSELFSGALIK